MAKIWTNSGDSHLVEPDDLSLWKDRLSPELAARMPRSVKDPSGTFETIYVDGQEFRRGIPKLQVAAPEPGQRGGRAPGANDPRLRLKDLDDEGIWAELIYPSLLIWTSSIRDPALVRAGAQVINDWMIEFQKVSPRYVCAAVIPLLTIEDAIAEIKRSADLGFKAAQFPVKPPGPVPFQHADWDPVWATLEETGTVLGFHVGTEPHEASTGNAYYNKGRGGALLNFYETTFGGQRAAAAMVASGAFDRYPGLKVIVSEGGATWGPFLADRLDEGYRQHSGAVSPKLRRLPSEYIYSNVYASFQHDRSAVYAYTAAGWRNVCFGWDYPHVEGTFGHTQKTLHELFDDLTEADRYRITRGAFLELFPHVGEPPQALLQSE